MRNKTKNMRALICGILGCLCYGGGDWLIPISETLMLPVFLYWFYLQITDKTVFKKGMAFTNVLVIFEVLKVIASCMPESAFRLGFTNGLMSESMIIWFVLILTGTGSKEYKTGGV